MELSIIVVNYNVKYFLQICLESLQAGSSGLESEIIVVDNASSDGSVAMIRQNFPSIHLISNQENAGFGRACNQALKIARGRHILFINPDTLVGESLLGATLKMFQEDDKTGAVGVCLLDGNGHILRESKRSIPTLWTAFTKFSGLSDVFRHSPLFNGYYAPELGYEESGEIEVLPGAFMMIRKDILDELEGFDPQFFMYAEDIDLSYRITRAGYRIRYEGSLHIIHFKGESTQKGLTSYTNTFFHSMKLFIRKYTGELYAPSVAYLLRVVVSTIQGVQKIKKKIFSVHKPDRKLPDSSKIYVVTKSEKMDSALSGYLKHAKVSRVPEVGLANAPFYLRYLPSYMATHRDMAFMLDHRSLTFDQIVKLWKSNKCHPLYLLDGENSFFIHSHNKEKQGEVHTFG